MVPRASQCKGKGIKGCGPPFDTPSRLVLLPLLLLLLQGERALSFVLRNQGMIDKTLLFDIDLIRIQK